MEENFGAWEQKEDELEVVEKDKVRDILNEVSKREKEFAPFILQLNDIENLKEFHIAETNFIKEQRKALLEALGE